MKNFTFLACLLISTFGFSQVSLPIDFESTTINYDLADFGGNASGFVVDPTDPNNTVVQSNKPDFAELWAGTTASNAGLTEPIPFTTAATKMTVRVWSPDAGIPVRLKVEDATDPTISVETEAMTTIALAWETLEFDFNNEAAGTAAINLASTYDKVSIFFNFGTTGAMAGNKTYFWDDVAFVEAPTVVMPSLPIDFQSTTIDYDLTDFGGNTSSIIEDVTDPGNFVVQSTKSDAAELWAGTTASNAGLAAPIPFTAATTKMTVRVWSPDAGIPVRLKVEDATDPTISVETEAMTTSALTWETLEFDFNNEAAGTAAINLANTYDKVSIFFNFGTTGAMAGEKIYFWDDVAFVDAPVAILPSLPIDFQSTTIDYDLTDFGGNTSSIIEDITDPGNFVIQSTKSDAAELWAGTTASNAGLAAPIPFTAAETKMTVRVWSPDAGIPVRLKVEDATDPTISVETEAMTTSASAWEILEFDFNNEAAGTAAINLANTYDKVSIFFNFGTTGAMAGEKTYFWDDVAFVEVVTEGIVLPVDFESSTIDYEFGNFGGGLLELIDNPDPSGINTSANVARMIKNAPEPFGGSFMDLEAPIDFSENNIFKMNVWAPAVGTAVLLKVENLADPGIFFEQTATTTTAMAWEELTFDFSAIDATQSYQRIVLIFDNGTVGDGSAAFTYFLDDIRLEMGEPAPRPDLPITFEDTDLDYSLTDFGGNASSIVVDPTDPNNLVGQAIKTAGAEIWAGTTIGVAGLENPIPFTPTETKMTVRVWSPDAGTPIRVKVEDASDPTRSVETEAITTVAMAWETLEFDFSNEAPGTAALNLDFTFDKISIFFNFGTDGATAGEQTYFWDDMEFGALVGIEVLDAAANGIKVSPNPASYEVNIEFPASFNEPAEIQLLDLTGRMVQYFEVADQQTRLELGSQITGMYFLRIQSNDKVYLQKLMITK